MWGKILCSDNVLEGQMEVFVVGEVVVCGERVVSSFLSVRVLFVPDDCCCICDCVHKTLVVCMPYFEAQGNLSPYGH